MLLLLFLGRTLRSRVSRSRWLRRTTRCRRWRRTAAAIRIRQIVYLRRWRRRRWSTVGGWRQIVLHLRAGRSGCRSTTSRAVGRVSGCSRSWRRSRCARRSIGPRDRRIRRRRRAVIYPLNRNVIAYTRASQDTGDAGVGGANHIRRAGLLGIHQGRLANLGCLRYIRSVVEVLHDFANVPQRTAAGDFRFVLCHLLAA